MGFNKNKEVNLKVAKFHSFIRFRNRTLVLGGGKLIKAQGLWRDRQFSKVETQEEPSQKQYHMYQDPGTEEISWGKEMVRKEKMKNTF